MKEYAIYRGDSLIFIGTIKECAEHMGVEPKTVRFYTTPAYQRRVEKRKNARNCLAVVCLDDE